MIKTPSLNDVFTPEEKTRMDSEADGKNLVRSTLKEIDSIHPAGLVGKDFVIEPIGVAEYAYNVCGTMGVANAIKDYEHDNPKAWVIEIEGVKIPVDGKPLEKGDLIIFNNPNVELVKRFLKGKIQPLTTSQLIKLLRHYYRTFIDLSEPEYYDGLVINTFQSWLLPALDSVFFLAITGEFGGGKTTILEASSHTMRHGCMPNPSVAFIGRGLDRLQLTPCIDEFDILGEQDSEIYRLIRECQRRGNVYTRTTDKGEKFVSFKTFANVSYTVHGQVETALESRNINIFTSQSQDPRLGKLGKFLKQKGAALYDQLFIWYMQEIPKIYNLYLEQIERFDLSKNIQEELPEVSSYRDFLTSLLPTREEVERERLGRDSELDGVFLDVMGYLKLMKTGELTKELVIAAEDKKAGGELCDSFDKLLNIKEDVREENKDIGDKGLLREFIKGLIKDKEGNNQYRNNDGYIVVSHKELFDGFVEYRKNHGEYQNLSSSRIKGMLRDFGFSDGKNKRKTYVFMPGKLTKTSRMSYIFDEVVKRRTELDWALIVKQEELDVNSV